MSISGYDGGDLGETVSGCGAYRTDLDEGFSVCSSDRRESPKYALLGDSKALALFPGLVRTSATNERWSLIGGNGPLGPVEPILSSDEIYKQYQKSALAAVEKIAANPNFEKIVIVAATRSIFLLNNEYSIDDLESSANFDSALAGIQSFTKKLLPLGKKIVFVIDNPTFKDPDDCLVRNLRPKIIDEFVNGNEKSDCKVAIAEQIRLSMKYRKLLDQVKSLSPEMISVFDTTNILCNTVSEDCSMTKNHRLLYGYTDHISDYAAGLVGQDLNRYLSSM